MEWIKDNLATIIVAAIVALALGTVVFFMIRRRIKGRGGSCCSGCSGCPSANRCGGNKPDGGKSDN